MNYIEKIKPLTVNELCEIQNFYDQKKIQLKLSVFSLYQWKSYGYEVLYLFEKNDYYFFSKSEKVDNAFDGHIVFLIDFISAEYVSNLIRILDSISHQFFFFSEKLSDSICEELKIDLCEEYLPRVSNYYYETKKLIGFPGKKMQKKRNHYNGFIKTFENHRIEKIDESNLEKAKQFIYIHSDDKKSEWASYQHIFNFYLQYPNWFKGSLLYVDDKIVGATIGIVNNDIYEIMIEKALKNYRGSFQFLLSENLRLHNITTPFVDRQDDLNRDNLIQSKESYHPDDKITILAYCKKCLHN